MEKGKLLRLNESLYRVTDLMHDEEPLKWSLRRKALKIQELCFALKRDMQFHDKVKRHDEINATIFEIADLLDLAASNAYISRANFDVLHREYRALTVSSFQDEFESQNGPVKQLQTQEVVPDDQQLTERQAKILKYLSAREWSSIGDLSQRFAGSVSEKTLQRDLTDLTFKRLIRREGDKRWRKYMLVDMDEKVE